MAYMKTDEAAKFKALARTMYFSNEVVDSFARSATAGQVRGIMQMIEDEGRVRERRKRERLLRKARFPAVKSFAGYDFSQVGFPEGYGADDIMALAFIESAQDFVFHGQTGRGNYA